MAQNESPQNLETQKMKAQQALASMNEFKPGIHTWSEGGAGCGHSLWNAQTIETIDAGAYRVEVAIRDTGWKTRVDILIVNQSVQPIDVHPEQIQLAANGKELKYNDPDSLIRSVRRRAALSAWGAALSTMGAAMQTATTTTQTTETGTVTATGPGGMATGTYSGVGTSTTTGPDYAAQRRAADQRAQAAQAGSDANSAIAYLQSIALRANTVSPAHQIYGAVYFDRLGRHSKETLLTVTVGSESFRFPVSWERK
jgi:hypothetical protein